MKQLHLFIDLDDTLLDFQASQVAAFEDLCHHLGVTFTPSLFQDFKSYNDELWRSLEKGQLKKETLVARRFPDFFAARGINLDPNEDYDAYFRHRLSHHPILVPYAKDLLDWLVDQDHYLYVASNGINQTQFERLEAAGLMHYFDQFFISGDLGYEKPHPEFFLQAFSQIDNFELKKAVFIGDSISSDMRGAQGIGMTKIWFNRNQLPLDDPQLNIDFEVSDLLEIKAIIDTLSSLN